MDCSTPGCPVHHQLPEFTHSCLLNRRCHPTISSSVIPFSSHLQSFPVSRSFQMSQLFASGGQSISVSASTSDSLVVQWLILCTSIAWGHGFKGTHVSLLATLKFFFRWLSSSIHVTERCLIIYLTFGFRTLSLVPTFVFSMLLGIWDAHNPCLLGLCWISHTSAWVRHVVPCLVYSHGCPN